MAKQEKKAAPSFEKALERLESIVAEMEGGSLSLEKLIADFEEGQQLIKFCTGKLNEIEKKVEILVKRGDTLTAEPFDADPEGGEPAPEREADLF